MQVAHNVTGSTLGRTCDTGHDVPWIIEIKSSNCKQDVHLHSQLGDFDPAITFGHAIAIPRSGFFGMYGIGHVEMTGLFGV